MNIGSVLVTGANRGVGFELIKQLVGSTSPPRHVFAACRSPNDAKDLKELQSKHSSVSIVKIDLCDLSSLPATVQAVEKTVGDAGLNLLINNAGIIFRETLETVTSEQMMEAFKVNAVGPLMVTQAFAPLLRKASADKAATHGSTISINRSAVINISSSKASIGENDKSNEYAYRTSKGGLNNITKSLSIDLKKDCILATAVHPGWIQTDMGGPRADLKPSDCVKTLLELIATFTSEEFTGKFYHYDDMIVAIFY